MTYKKNIAYAFGILVSAIIVASGVLFIPQAVQNAYGQCVGSCVTDFGAACSSATTCGSMQGTIGCTGSCEFNPLLGGAYSNPTPSNYGQPCLGSANVCGTRAAGYIGCNSSCTAGVPGLPSGYGSTCTSGANICGKTNSGVIGCSGTCPASTPSNLTCNPNVKFGCTDPGSANYDPQASHDNGSCVAEIIWGCTDSTAVNYTPGSNYDNGSCYYDTVIGCGDPQALNYVSSVTQVDNTQCLYGIPGCTNVSASNYNRYATVDNGTCNVSTSCPAGYVSVGDSCVVPGVITAELECSLDQNWNDNNNSCDQIFSLQTSDQPIYLRANPLVGGSPSVGSCSLDNFSWSVNGGTNVNNSVIGNQYPTMSLNGSGGEVTATLTPDSVSKILYRPISVTGTPSGPCPAATAYDVLKIRLLNITLIEE